VCVYLVGPWSVKTPSGVKKLRAFTAIDTATGCKVMVNFTIIGYVDILDLLELQMIKVLNLNQYLKRCVPIWKLNFVPPHIIILKEIASLRGFIKLWVICQDPLNAREGFGYK
jgi:putative effector of murein hydrolase LrgA (UPF0299 family)